MDKQTKTEKTEKELLKSIDDGIGCGVTILFLIFVILLFKWCN